ncbi:hypothetical protein QCA50_019796 [Cerrena zonata]|uniref:BTB domain-containing protein n=1 Tax=Cerrena zonata TaxID=2478898 RepID=A0AAW0FJ37_9APHY
MSQPHTVAAAPFNEPIASANIILRSCDSVHFYVSKDVLILASPFFRTMLSLQQPVETGTDLPIVPVSEDSKTLDYLLRLCYPIIPPSPLSDLSDASKALSAAIKYDMDKALWAVKKELHALGLADPPRMFAIACQLHLEDEALAAANMWRDQGKGKLPYHELVSTSYRQEMEQISAGAFRRFLLRVQSGTSNGPLCRSPSKVKQTSEGKGDKTTHESAQISTIDIGAVYNTPTDTTLRSADGIDILIHRTILSMISSTTLLLPDTTSESGPIVECDEDALVLVKLLELCYPVGDTRFVELIARIKNKKNLHPFDRDIKVYDAVAKYQLGDDVKKAALKKVMSHVHSDPLKVFFVAVSLKRHEEAQLAAKCIINQEPFQSPQAHFMSKIYEENMERDGSAIAYRDLIAYLNQHCSISMGAGSTTFAIATIPAPAVLQFIEDEYVSFQRDELPRGIRFGRRRDRLGWNSSNAKGEMSGSTEPSPTELAFTDTLTLIADGKRRGLPTIPLIELTF